MAFRIFMYVALIVFGSLYPLMVYITPEADTIKIIGFLNIMMFIVAIILLARRQIYYIWGGYVVLLVGYYALLSPYLPIIPEIVVIVAPSIVGLIAVYDIVIKQSAEVLVRIKARGSWPRKRK